MRKFLKVLLILILIISLISSVIAYGTFVSVSSISIVNQKISSTKINDDMNDLKIAFISDIHYNHFMNKERLTKMIERINAFKPDILLFGGDLFDDPTLYPINENVTKELAECLSQLQADYGKFAVLGETDHHESVLPIVEDLLFQADFELLKNQNIQLTKEGASTIYLIGIDSLVGGNPDVEMSLQEVDTNAFTIVLTHAPDLISQLPSNGIDLVLAGHSHGGQIALPFIGALNKKEGALSYSKGEYWINQTQLIVSNGMGTTNTDIRIFADPQCHILRLTNK